MRLRCEITKRHGDSDKTRHDYGIMMGGGKPIGVEYDLSYKPLKLQILCEKNKMKSTLTKTFVIKLGQAIICIKLLVLSDNSGSTWDSVLL